MGVSSQRIVRYGLSLQQPKKRSCYFFPWKPWRSSTTAVTGDDNENFKCFLVFFRNNLEYVLPEVRGKWTKGYVILFSSSSFVCNSYWNVGPKRDTVSSYCGVHGIYKSLGVCDTILSNLVKKWHWKSIAYYFPRWLTRVWRMLLCGAYWFILSIKNKIKNDNIGH